MKKQLINPGNVIVLLLLMSFQTLAWKKEPDKTQPFTFGNDYANPDLWCQLYLGSKDSGIEPNSRNNLVLSGLSAEVCNVFSLIAIIPEQVNLSSPYKVQVFKFNDNVIN
jgi:hypothetical protein